MCWVQFENKQAMFYASKREAPKDNFNVIAIVYDVMRFSLESSRAWRRALCRCGRDNQRQYEVSSQSPLCNYIFKDTVLCSLSSVQQISQVLFPLHVYGTESLDKWTEGRDEIIRVRINLAAFCYGTLKFNFKFIQYSRVIREPNSTFIA